MTQGKSGNSGLRILVVDDEESLREVVSQVLEEEGYEVTRAESGETALGLAAKRPFHVVITDIRMAGMDGIQLLREVKRINKDTQVIIMTSQASLNTVIDALRLGAYDYLIKPFDSLELITAVVNRALDKLKLTIENRKLLKRLQLQNKELAEANERLKELAVRDGLTGLFNHRYFRELLNHEIARSKRKGQVFSLLFFDVDYFKQFNDTHGHLEGDNLLASLGRLLRERLRESDSIARYGGEEFVVLLPETEKVRGIEVADGIRALVERHEFQSEDGQPLSSVTVSIGVAAYPLDGEDASDLVQNADSYLYQAKNGGRNRVCAGYSEDEKCPALDAGTSRG